MKIAKILASTVLGAGLLIGATAANAGEHYRRFLGWCLYQISS